MRLLGISGSARNETASGVHALVRTVLDATGLAYELVSLKGKTIKGCIACLGCVKDNVCKVKDDLEPLRDKIVEADAYVIGAPNYYSGMNALTHAFLERWFQFRHQEGSLLWGKLAVAVGVGGTDGHYPAMRWRSSSSTTSSKPWQRSPAREQLPVTPVDTARPVKSASPTSCTVRG